MGYHFARAFGIDMGMVTMMQDMQRRHDLMMQPFVEAERQRRLMMQPFIDAAEQQRKLMESLRPPSFAWADQINIKNPFLTSPVAAFQQSIQFHADIYRNAFSAPAENYYTIASPNYFTLTAPEPTKRRRAKLSPADHKKHLQALAVLEPNTTVTEIQLSLRFN